MLGENQDASANPEDLISISPVISIDDEDSSLLIKPEDGTDPVGEDVASDEDETKDASDIVTPEDGTENVDDSTFELDSDESIDTRQKIQPDLLEDLYG